MKHSRKSGGRLFVESLAFVLGGIAIGSRLRLPENVVEAEVHVDPPQLTPPQIVSVRRGRSFGMRLATVSSFVALFVAGGAFAAWGGNQAAQVVNDQATPVAADAQSSASAEAVAADGPAQADAAPSDAAPGDAAPGDVAPSTATAVAESTVSVTPDESASVTTAAAVEPAGDAVSLPAATPGAATPPPTDAVPSRTALAPVAHRRAARHGSNIVRMPSIAPVTVDSETSALPGAAIVWRNLALPDPTPASPLLQRLSVHRLVATSGADWPIELALLHVRGDDVRPQSVQTLLALADNVSAAKAQGQDDWQAVLALTGDPAEADRVLALSRYYRAVGTETLATGLRASRVRLGHRVLTDPRVTIYPAGRDDIQAGRVNERVLAVIAYLAETFGSVEISSLVSGHRLYARPRVISAHVFGEAVDVAALGGESVAGNQEPGGIVERAVRALLFLPADAEPRQIISLFEFGGPSFALSDHADHIHVGF